MLELLTTVPSIYNATSLLQLNASRLLSYIALPDLTDFAVGNELRFKSSTMVATQALPCVLSEMVRPSDMLIA